MMIDGCVLLNYLNNYCNWYLSEDSCLRDRNESNVNKEDIILFRVDQMPDTAIVEKISSFENILDALKLEGINLIFITYGTKDKITYYYGLVQTIGRGKTGENNNNNLDLSADIFSSCFTGYFSGSKVVKLKDNEKKELLEKMASFAYATYLEGTPGVLEDARQEVYIQKFPSIMKGDDFIEYTIIQSIECSHIYSLMCNINGIIDTLSPMSNSNVTRSQNESTTTSTSDTLSAGCSKVNTSSQTRLEQKTLVDILAEEGNQQIDRDITEQIELDADTGIGLLPVLPEEGELEQIQKDLPDSEKSDNKDRESDQEVKLGLVGGEDATAKSRSDSCNKSNAKSSSLNNSMGKSVSRLNSVSVTCYEVNVNTEAVNWKDYIISLVKSRLVYGIGKGLYLFDTVMLTNTVPVMSKLSTTVKNRWVGAANFIPVKATKLSVESQRYETLLNFQIPLYYKIDCKHRVPFTLEESILRSAFSQIVLPEEVYAATFVSCREAAFMLAIPEINTSSKAIDIII